MLEIEYVEPKSWDDKGMDWNNPDPRRADYVMAIRGALMERAAAAHCSLDRAIKDVRPYAPVSIEALIGLLGDIRDLAPYYVNVEWTDYKEDMSDFPRMWTYRDLVNTVGCELYLTPCGGDILENGGAWLRRFRAAIDRLTTIRCTTAWGATRSRSGSIHDPPFNESIGGAMEKAFGERQPSTGTFSKMPSSYSAWSGNTHWKCPQPLDEGEQDWEGNVDGYCGYAESSEFTVTRVRNWLVGRTPDFVGYSLVGAPTEPVPYSQELATSIFDPGESGSREGLTIRREQIESPSSMSLTFGYADSIPQNGTVPQSDFDEEGYAIHRRSAKRGYEAKFWAFLDYGVEGGFRFRADG